MKLKRFETFEKKSEKDNGKTFKEIDKNKNNKISWAEAKKSGISKAEFDKLDTNDDGKISKSEFKKADTNKDGKLSKKELEVGKDEKSEKNPHKFGTPEFFKWSKEHKKPKSKETDDGEKSEKNPHKFGTPEFFKWSKDHKKSKKSVKESRIQRFDDFLNEDNVDDEIRERDLTDTDWDKVYDEINTACAGDEGQYKYYMEHPEKWIKGKEEKYKK